jgi:hypothetical protein
MTCGTAVRQRRSTGTPGHFSGAGGRFYVSQDAEVVKGIDGTLT